MIPRHPLWYVLVMVLCSTSACRTVEPQSTIKIENGVRTTSNQLVPVVRVDLGQPVSEICTGSFLNSTTVLTAAHCVFARSLSDISVGGIKPVKMLLPHPQIASLYAKADREGWNGGPANREFTKYDMALLRFPPGTANRLGVYRFLNIEKTPAIQGQFVYMVGFGKTNRTDEFTEGRKTWGTNNISVITDGVVFLSGGDSPKIATHSLILNGDSGGPLLVPADPATKKAEAAVGLFSTLTGVHISNTYVFLCASIQSNYARDFFRNAIADGFESFDF